MKVENHELVNYTRFRRQLSQVIGDLEERRTDKVVVTKHGQMAFVVLTVDKYEELLK
jgi:prevent-host-death family protein